MRSTLVRPVAVQAPRGWVLVLDPGDDPIAELERFSREQGLGGAHFTAIGAFSEAVLAFFDWEAKAYRDIPVDGQTEVVSLTGDVALGTEGPKVHAHVVLGRPDGAALGGHLRSARVRPTLEVVLEETPDLRRVHDPQTGLALIDLPSR